MISQFESEKNRKALIYTVIICVTILLLFFVIRWKNLPPPEPVIVDLIEINLGNDMDGFGEEQPLIKGQRGPSVDNLVRPRPTPPVQSTEKVIPEDDGDGAEMLRPNKEVKKTTTQPIIAPPVPKPKKPKATMSGAGNGTGNNDTEDNGFTSQGNTPGGKGDAGSPNGNPDSYGNTPGGKVGGPRITKGNRKIVKYYSFTGELAKATIFATIKVSASGRGTFVSFAKGSTSRNQAYANAITNYLANIEFDKASSESMVTVQFNFNIN